jgi:hypothetical protein
MIRQLMFQKTNRKDYLGDIFDLEEFLMHLCEDVNFNSICNFVNSSDIDGAIVCPLVLSIVSAGFKSVHASLQASILYTLNAKETSLIDLPTAFFARVRPGNFDLPPLVLPQTHVYLETGTYINGEHVVDKLIKAIYTLSAIVCIKLSHYVLFLRLKNGEWFFFDSMRKIDSGHHVPTSTHVPNFQNYLESGCDKSLLPLKSDASPGESRDSFHERVTKDAYAYLFTATSEVSKESERIGLPAEKPLLDARRMWEASQQTANAHLHVMQLGQFSSQSSSARGGGAAAVLEQPSPSSRKPSAGGATVSRPQPPQKPSARGGEAAVSHKPSGSFEHSQCTLASKSQPWMERLQEFFPNLFIKHLSETAVKSSGKYNPSHYDLANYLALLSSIEFDFLDQIKYVDDSAFICIDLKVSSKDFTDRHSVVSSFQVGDIMCRVTAVVFSDGHVIASPELKDLQKGNPRRDELRNDFYQEIDSYFLRFPRLDIDKMLIEPCA